MSLTLIIGDKNISSWSLRPWLAMKHAGIAFREETVRLHLPQTRERILPHSPSGRVPALQDGDLKIWDSLAICEYLADRFPEKRLWPADVAARAIARCVCAEMHSGFATLRSACAMNITAQISDFKPAPDVVADTARVEAMWADARRRFGKGGPFLFGAFSIADAFYAPVVTRIRTYALKISRDSQAYCDAVWALPAMEEWLAGARAELGHA